MQISKWIKIWLLAGLFMLFMQVIIGGITRLTGSGLSITKWEIVIGAIPPMSKASWEEAFRLYQETSQYKKINEGMSLQEFKFIYFWEYLHRLWARLMGFVFLIPFLLFLYKRKMPDWLIRQLGIVILLAGLAASFGWIMVMSGLQDRPWVNAYKLSIHLAIGFSVFCYLLWICFKVFAIPRLPTTDWLRYFGVCITLVICIQIIFGGWMSGMRAGLIYPTWPDMHGEFFPQLIFNINNWNVDNFINYDSNTFVPALIQFLHRMTAYLLIMLSFGFIYQLMKNTGSRTMIKYALILFIIMLITQVLVGILTVLHCVGSIPVFYGVLHQGLGLVLLSSSLLINYQLIRSG